MLDLLLTPTDGGTAWRHLLADGEARAGFECVGPLGLARRVGRVLGIPSEPARAPDRLADLERRLQGHDDGNRSYSASRKVDPFGVASFLLGLRDGLRLAGWRGTPLRGSARLEDLGELEALGAPASPPGFPDVLDALAREVESLGRLPLPLGIRLAAPREGFPPALLRLLDALAAAGAAIESAPPDAPLAPPGTDLGRLQRALIDGAAPRAALQGDGTLLLLEADTPIEAAELAASFARERPLGPATFLIAAEPGALDGALSRQGLPTLGLSTSSRLRPHLQVLPLRLTLAFRPQDPFRAAELLVLPGAPLPGWVRNRLLDALNEMPGIGGPAWSAAVEAAVVEEEERARARGATQPDARASGRQLASRLEQWFGGDLFDPSEGIPAAKAAALCAMVARWAGSRTGAAGGALEDGAAPDDAGLWGHAAAVAGTLQRMLVSRAPEQRLTQLALAQLHDLAAGSGSDRAAFEGQAGRPAVCREPEGVLPGAVEVLWWGFVQGAGNGRGPEPWTAAEREVLSAAGLSLPAAGEARRFEAWCWRRPILAARERVALVRWRISGADPVAAHPFADELSIRLAAGALAACTSTSERLLAGERGPWEPRAQEVVPADPIVPHPVWRAPPEALEPVGLSAKALESLLGCPFRWALQYQGLLYPGRGVDLPEGDQLLGTFAHRILQDMVLGRERLDVERSSEDEAKQWAGRAFDARVASEAAPLVRRGGEADLDRARTLVAGAAAALVGHLKAGGWKVKAAELPVSGRFAGHDVVGYVDLVLEKEGTEALLDLKLSRGRRREELEMGRALQLALYASLLKSGGRALPPTGYLILEDGQLLTVNAGAFPGAAVIEGPSARETLQGAEAGFAYWRKVLSKGLLPILGEGLAWEEAVEEAGGPAPDEESPARREPGCLFCRYGALCHASVGEGRAR